MSDCETMADGGAAGTAPALAFQGVTFSYGAAAVGARVRSGAAEGTRSSTQAPLINGLTLEIPADRVTGIVGPNGCGKSTLLKLADGLLEPQAGSILVAGAAVSALSARERARRVALLPQIHRTPSMTVRSLVMCGRYAHMGVFGRPTAEDERAVEAALAEVGIARLAQKPARRLSGGERQRAFIAMAVAQEAGLLLLDEPTTYLDVRASFETMALVHELGARRRMTAIAVIHDLDLALRTCDDIVVMERGGIAAQGAAGDAGVCEAIGRVFGVTIAVVDTPQGRAYATFPR